MLTACGTSWHAALVGEYLIEDLAQIPVEVEYASELRYRNPPLDNDTLLFAITQSGETADTLAALRGDEAQGLSRRWPSATSSAARSPRRPTAAFICTPDRKSAWPRPRPSRRSASSLAMLALYFGRLRHLSFDAGMRIIERLQELPDQVRQALQDRRRSAADRREVLPTATTSCTWAGNTTSPPRWKAR